MEPTLAAKMKSMNLTYEDLEAARTLISLSTPKKNMDDDTLKILRQAFDNHVAALTSETGVKLQNSRPQEIGKKVYQHLYDQAFFLRRLLYAGELDYNEENQKTLTDIWAEANKSRTPAATEK